MTHAQPKAWQRARAGLDVVNALNTELANLALPVWPAMLSG